MATLGAQLQTLADITNRMDPDGKIAMIGEWLSQQNEVVSTMLWQEGNLPTGERTTVRVGLPSTAYRGLNEGVARSKSRVAQVDEGAALLESQSECDREAAKLSGNVEQYRLTESAAHFEAMTQQMATTLFYGNAATSPKEFTGLSPRYNDLDGDNADQIVTGGGSGNDNSSIWLIGWGATGVKGIYPKGSKAGLSHIDVTKSTGVADDGVDIGTYIDDADGNQFLALLDQYNWACGLSVKDPRYAVRIPNIDKSLLTIDYSTGANIQDLMVEALNRIHSLETPGMKFGFYMPRNIQSFLQRQILNTKNAFLNWDTVGESGKRMLSFGDVPIYRTDALKADEAAVTT